MSSLVTAAERSVVGKITRSGLETRNWRPPASTIVASDGAMPGVLRQPRPAPLSHGCLARPCCTRAKTDAGAREADGLCAEHVLDVLEGVRRERVRDSQVGVSRALDRMSRVTRDEDAGTGIDAPGRAVDRDDARALEHEVHLWLLMAMLRQGGARRQPPDTQRQRTALGPARADQRLPPDIAALRDLVRRPRL